MDSVDEQLGGAPAHFVGGLPDRRQRRRGVRGQPDIVEADDRHILRHPAAAVRERRGGADGSEVIRGKDGGERGGRVEERLDTLVPGLLREVAGDDKAPIVGDASPAERFAVAGQAFVAHSQPDRSRDVSDEPVAKLEEMLGGDSGPLAVIDVDERRRRVVDVAVQRNDGNSVPGKASDRLAATDETDQQGAVNLLRDQHLEVLLLAGSVARDAAKQDGVASLIGEQLDPLHEVGEEGVGDVGHEQGERVGGFGHQASRDRVGPVSQDLDRLFDAVPGLGSHRARAIEEPRHCGSGDARAPGNVVNGRLHRTSLPLRPHGPGSAVTAYM